MYFRFFYATFVEHGNSFPLNYYNLNAAVLFPSEL